MPPSLSEPGSTGPAGQGAELSVPSVPCSVAAVRHFARGACDGLPPGTADTVELLVSEIATNALVHGSGEVRVRVNVLDGTVRVEVDDDGTALPQLRAPSGTSEGGRGLALVHAMSGGWGVAPRPGGKTVWFEVTA